MKHSKKAIIVSVVFVLIIALIHGIVTIPYVLYLDDDRMLRNELAGTTDYFIVGASHGLAGFVPQVLDEKMGCNSYNLSGSLTTFNGRLALLDDELYRNPVKTVIIDISYDAFSRETLSDEGNMYIIPRFNSINKKVNYFIDNEAYENIVTLYSYYFSHGLRDFPKLGKLVIKGIKERKNLIEYIKTNKVSSEQRIDKGHERKNKLKAPLFSEDKLMEIHNSLEIDRNYNQENINTLGKMVKMCKEKNVDVIFAVVPVSDDAIWQMSNWDDFYNDILKISEEMDCRLIDFNLLKNRYELFPDYTSFADKYHLSNEGARTFSEEFSKILNKINNGENVDDMFYSTYSEIKERSPYSIGVN